MTVRRTLSLLLAALVPVACKTTAPAPEKTGPTLADYGRPLPPGRSSLRLVTETSDMPDLAAAYRNHDALTLQALDRSIEWFTKPSSRNHFPMEGVSHERAAQSLIAFRDLLRADPEIARHYGEEKTRLAELHRSERQAYQDGKTPFIERVMRQAGLE